MKVNRNIILLLFILVTLVLVSGCANKTKELLAVKYQEMSDNDLLRYFYQLNDEIDRLEKQSGPRVGIGIGGFGSHTGGGIGINTGTGGSSAEELRKRRIDVRLALKERGVEP
jgi:hypothetical protein